MVLNIAIDGAIGLVPILGDFADALFKANTNNAWLLTSFLEKRGQANLSQNERKNQEPSRRNPGQGGALGYDGNAEYVSEQPPQYISRHEPQKPPPTYFRQGSTKLNTWLGGLGRGGRAENDVERGEKSLPPRPPRR